MKKVLFLAFSALLCLTVVNCLKCKVCHTAPKGKCLQRDKECTAPDDGGTCKTMIFKETGLMMYFCGEQKGCNETTITNPPVVRHLYVACCETDLCNGPQVAKPPGFLETQ